MSIVLFSLSFCDKRKKIFYDYYIVLLYMHGMQRESGILGDKVPPTLRTSLLLLYMLVRLSLSSAAVPCEYDCPSLLL